MHNSASNNTESNTASKNDKSGAQDDKPSSFWQRYQAPVLLTVVGGAIDTIGFITLFGFFTAHVTGNLVLAGSGLVKGEKMDYGLSLRLYHCLF